MENSKRIEMIVCPHNPNHRVLQSCLSKHLISCSKNRDDVKMVCCPFNATHMVKGDELQAHVLRCMSGKPGSKTVLRPTLDDCSNEPSVLVINPENHCENTSIPRRLEGESNGFLRKLREIERLRFENIKLNK